MRISIYRPGKVAPFSILCCSLLNALARASKDWKSFRSREKPHGTVCRHFGYSRPYAPLEAIRTNDDDGRVVWRPVMSIWMTSPFSDSIVFTVHTRKQRSQSKSIVFKSFHPGERFRMTPFSAIVFGVVVWTIAVSGAKQLRFRLKTDWCGRSLSLILFSLSSPSWFAVALYCLSS